jgi:hypothetical protein
MKRMLSTLDGEQTTPELLSIRTAPTRHCVESGSRPRKIQQEYIGALLRSFEDSFTAIWRDVEVAYVEVGSKVG